MSDLLAARFEALVEPGEPDWLDVRRQARRHGRRRVALAVAVAGAFLAVPAVAIALDPTILPWNSAAPAPSSAVRNFAELSIGAPPGMDPHARPGEARTVPLADGSVVWVDPAANGGFCEDFKTGAGGCDQTRKFPISDILGSVGSFPCGSLPDAVRVDGHVIAKPGSTLELDFSDGTSMPLSLTWVGAPISAGFFEAASGKRMKGLVLRDPGGSVIATDTKLFESFYNGFETGITCPADAKVSTGS